MSNSADVVDAEIGLYEAYKLRYGSSFFDRARVVWTPSGSTVRQRLESVQKKFSRIAIRLLGLVYIRTFTLASSILYNFFYMLFLLSQHDGLFIILPRTINLKN